MIPIRWLQARRAGAGRCGADAVPVTDENNFRDPDAGANPLKDWPGGPFSFIDAEEVWPWLKPSARRGTRMQRAAWWRYCGADTLQSGMLN